MDTLADQRVRLAAFEWLAHQVDLHGDVLPWKLIFEEFKIDGERVPLVSQQGIFKPRLIPEIPLSIRTSPAGPYDDRADESGGFLLYKYRGTDAQLREHRDNVGLRQAMQQRVPLIYFYGLAKGRYLAIWPVFVVGDDIEQRTFTIAVDDLSLAHGDLGARVAELSVSNPETGVRRAYVTAAVRHRIHQRSFRERVMRAYREQCALCRLRHEELLEAAHIIPDKEPEGIPIVSNGLALCKLHHAAFDKYFIGIRPDYVVEVRRDVLEEHDGPMLVHGLQRVHLRRLLVLPRRRAEQPDPARLSDRYERFRAAG